jgi:hypothetical protein
MDKFLKGILNFFGSIPGQAQGTWNSMWSDKPVELRNPNITPTPAAPSVTPTPQAVQYGSNSNINDIVPKNIANPLLSIFGPIAQATNSAQVLRHPMAYTNLPGEQQRGVNTGPNMGENPNLTTSNIDIPNPDGSMDRGLFRINSNTFNDFMKRKPDVLKKAGINSYDDMNDPLKNIMMAKIIYEEQGWKGWFAAPRNLRQGR